MAQELWVKAVENPILKPIDQWRDDLYGYWMVFSDSQLIDGEEQVVARYYGTDREKLYEKYSELHNESDEPTVGIYCNKRGNNWMGGVFLVKSES